VISTETHDPEKFTFQLSPVSFAALLIPRHGPFAVFEKLVFAQLVKNSPHRKQSVIHLSSEPDESTHTLTP